MPNPNSIHGKTPPQKAAIAALLLPLAIGTAGCTAESWGLAEEKQVGERVDEHSVVAEGGSFPTPADRLSNIVFASREFATAYGEEGVDEDSRAALLDGAKQKDLIAVDQVVTRSQFYKITQADSNIVSSPDRAADISRMLAPIDKITDPVARKIAETYVRTAVTEDVVDGVRFDHIEPGDAKEILDVVDKRIFPKLKKVIETADAANNIIRNYYAPDRVRDDASDITDSKLRKLLFAYAKDIERGGWGDEYYEAVVSKDKKNKAAIGSIEKKAKTAQDNFYKVYGQEEISEAFQQTIIEQNNLENDEIFQGLPELADPGRSIDLRGVHGPKTYVDRYDSFSTPETLHEFAEAYSDNGMVTLAFAEGSGISDEAKQQIERLFKDVEPMIHSGMANGDILAVRFVIADSYDPYFRPASHEIVMILPANTSMSEDQLRSGMVHETIHALVQTAFSLESQVTTKEATLIKKACTALSKQAYDSAESLLSVRMHNLDTLIATAQTGQDKKIFTSLKKIISENRVAKTLLDGNSLATDDYFKKNIDYTHCQSDSVNYASLILHAIEESGIADDKAGDVYDSLDERYLGEENEDANYRELIDAWIDAKKYLALWDKLNESAHVDTRSSIKEYLGHADDNATEFMATTVDVTLNNRDSVSQLIRGLGLGDKKIVRQAIAAAYTVVANRHPSMKAYLDKTYAAYAKL